MDVAISSKKIPRGKRRRKWVDEIEEVVKDRKLEKGDIEDKEVWKIA